MTRTAKQELKERYVMGLARFLEEELPNDPATVTWVEAYKARHMKEMEEHPQFIALPDDRKTEIRNRIAGESFKLVPLLQEVSEQKLWQQVQGLCLNMATVVRMLQVETEISAAQKLRLTVETAQTRIVAMLHMMKALQGSQSQEEYEAGCAMTLLCMALKRIAEFPFDQLKPENADKLVRYLKAIVTLVAPVAA
jgi:hypothetical protein